MDTPPRKNPSLIVGRKGDPRMHRAVAAKLNDPSLSSFEALKIGGFDYPYDDDATVVDSENITLVQRKNQLSRRIRLAKQQQEQEEEMYRLAASLRPSVLQPAAYASLPQEAMTSIQNPASSMDTTNTSFEGSNNAVFHGSDRFHVAGTASSLHSVGFPGGYYPDSDVSQMHIQNLQAGAPYIPTQTFTASQVPMPNQYPLHHASLTASEPSSFNDSTSNALLRLSDVADRQGMTLEGLAQALSSKPEVVTNPKTQPGILEDDESISSFMTDRSRRQLALDLFSSETIALYRRCMLMAGYSSEDVFENSREYLDFALEAWKTEGMRLQSSLLMQSDHPNLTVQNPEGNSGSSFQPQNDTI
jgi:hypothetical protein